MRIAQISTNTIPVPPKRYGGTQREVHYLTEELVKRGHEVFLFAKKGSKSNATQTFEYDSDDRTEQLDFIIKNMPPNIDIIHDHYGIVARANPPIPTIGQSHSNTFRSNVQIRVYVSKFILRKYGKGKGYAVHNGLRMDDYDFRKKKQNYLLFIGRLIKEKGVHLAIKVAKKTGRKLIIAGTLNDKNYFKAKIKPHLGNKIRYIGPVGGGRKRRLLADAHCVLFTSTWDEPFGLVLVEAMASGTPVLGFRRGGAVPEVLGGMPKLLCDTTTCMAAKVNNREGLPNARVLRRYARTRYSERTLADAFLRLYRRVIKKKLYKIKADTLWNQRLAELQPTSNGDEE